jgi:hypoxanthine phosphoribosyltransferase
MSEIDFPPSQALPVLIDADQIRKRVEELGRKISEDYSKKPLVLLVVLKGSFLFCADLVRQLSIPCRIEFIRASSYKDAKVSSGQLQLSELPNLRQANILIVEDILDSGLTLQKILEHLRSENLASLEVCTLLLKKIPRDIQIEPKYIGFEIPNRFVVGYGLDYAERYREVPEIRCLD